MGKTLSRPVGAGARWHVPTLQSLAATSLPLSTVEPRRNFGNPLQLPGRPSRKEQSVIREADMGVTSPSTKRKLSSAAAKMRGGSLERGSATKSTDHKASERIFASYKQPMAYQKRPVGPGTRTGASKDIPITIDDDNERIEGLPTNIYRQTVSPSIISPIASPVSRRMYSPINSASPPMRNYKRALPSVGRPGEVTPRTGCIYS
jgi:hypothetical protein